MFLNRFQTCARTDGMINPPKWRGPCVIDGRSWEMEQPGDTDSARERLEGHRFTRAYSSATQRNLTNRIPAANLISDDFRLYKRIEGRYGNWARLTISAFLICMSIKSVLIKRGCTETNLCNLFLEFFHIPRIHRPMLGSAKRPLQLPEAEPFIEPIGNPEFFHRFQVTVRVMLLCKAECRLHQ